MRGALTGPVETEVGVGDEFLGVGLGQIELGDRDGEDLFEGVGVGGGDKFLVTLFLGGDLVGRLFGQAGDFAPALEDVGELLVGGGGEVELLLAFLVVVALGLVALAEFRGDVLVVAGQGLEGFVGDAAFDIFAAGVADDGVAAFDVVIEEIQGFAGDVGFEPEGDLAEFDGERVDVDAVDAFVDDIAHGSAECFRRGLFFAGADDGEFGGDATGGSEQDVARAAGDVGNA